MKYLDKDEVDQIVEDNLKPSEEIKKHFFRQFMNDEINYDEYHQLVDDPLVIGEENYKNSGNAVKKRGIDLTGQLKNTDYPIRHHFKKRESSLKKIIMKVVNWWRN